MTLTALPLAGAFVADTTRSADSRGSFARLFCDAELGAAVGTRRIVQINHSRTSARGAIRGMHFQRVPHSEMKLVRCLKGRVYDVMVDLRAGSSSFLRWHACELGADNDRMMIIPEGCAHGFQALEPDSELLYLHTAAYRRDAEGGVRFDDPRLAIDWPLPPTELSARDRGHAPLAADFKGLPA
jgi:dTDP-4-dehydrorhamnose 3,5-epimerase